MAESTYYAWAPIHTRVKEGDELKQVNINVGDEVPSDLLDSIDDETKETWITDGVIRTRKYPENVPPGISVRTHLLREANMAYERAQAIGSPDAGEEPTTPEDQPPATKQAVEEQQRAQAIANPAPTQDQQQQQQQQ